MKATIIALDCVGWSTMQVVLARSFLHIPDRLFQKRIWLPRAAEMWIYRRMLGVRYWKDWLPDGERWLGASFSKKHLASHSAEHLEKFVLETRRGEAVHWIAIGCGFVFFAWNPREAWLPLLLVAAVLNLPCIVVQRYNRFRITGVLAWRGKGRLRL